MTIIFLILLIILFFIAEFVFSVIWKKYIGTILVSQCISFWTWVYSDWNYIGGTPIVRHIGVRWFGFEFEYTEEIPMGELF